MNEDLCNISLLFPYISMSKRTFVLLKQFLIFDIYFGIYIVCPLFNRTELKSVTYSRKLFPQNDITLVLKVWDFVSRYQYYIMSLMAVEEIRTVSDLVSK